jgi:hypothetical protein
MNMCVRAYVRISMIFSFFISNRHLLRSVVYVYIELNPITLGICIIKILTFQKDDFFFVWIFIFVYMLLVPYYTRIFFIHKKNSGIFFSSVFSV